MNSDQWEPKEPKGTFPRKQVIPDIEFLVFLGTLYIPHAIRYIPKDSREKNFLSDCQGKVPFKFTGTIEKVMVDLKEAVLPGNEIQERLEAEKERTSD